MNKLLMMPLVLAALLCGCGRTPLREYHPAALPPHPAENSVTTARAGELARIMAPLKVRGAGIFPAAVFGRYSTDVVLKALKQCGFNRIYCHITSERELNDELRTFVTAATNGGFAVEIVISQMDFYRRYQVNQMIRWAMVQYPDITEAAELVGKFNASLPENCRLAGVTLHLTPHLYNGKNVRRIYGSLYCWSGNRFGSNGDNDMLMKEAFAVLKKVAAIENMPPLTVAVADFYHEYAFEGKLSCGTVRDFAAVTPRVAVVNTANVPSKLQENVRNELKNAPAGSSLLTVIPLATHTSVNDGRLRRRNWSDMTRAIAHLTGYARNYPQFDGIILSPFSVVEYLRREL